MRLTVVRRLRYASIGVGLTLAVASPTLCQGQQLARSVRITDENDEFDFARPQNRRSDDNYTQGARIGWDGVGVPGAARRLYLRADVSAATANTRRDVAAIVGVTGPASLAQPTQEGFHHLFAHARPLLGWTYQLPTEPDMAVQFTQGWYLAPPGAGARWADVVPTAHAIVGTLRTAAGAGGRLRVGFDLDHPWLVDASPRLFTAFAFIGGSGEAVARDLFLDGSTFRPSLHRDHEPLITNWERGISVRISRFGLEYRAVTQNREYPAGPATHNFGGVTLTWWTAR